MKLKKNVKAQASPSTKTATAAPKAQATKAEAKGKIAEAKAKAKPVADEAKAPARIGINIGATSGMRIMAYQDHTFEINDRPDRRLTDEQLAADWRKEFPNSRAVQNGRITADMVRAVRRLYNAGTGGHGTPGTEHNSHPYFVQDGKVVKGVYTRARKEAAEVSTPQPRAEAADKKAGKGKNGKAKVAA
jgi:hypothetical protein